jgi:ABC-type branched-subunit amino acid transport system substrate-binding protein
VDERSGVARYVQCSIFVDVFFANSERPATKKFVDDFSSAYRRSPGFLEAHAFDAASILKRVLADRRPESREDVRSALANLGKPFEGAAGDTVFGKDREAQKPFFWLWINRGNIFEFDPEGPPPVPPAAPLADAVKPAKTR